MSDKLTEQFMDALREERLNIELSRNFNGRALARLSKPGATERSKPIQLAPIIVGEQGQTHSAMLRQLADAMDEARLV